MDFADYFKDDFEEPTPWPGSRGDGSQQALEATAAMMTCMSLLRLTKPGKQKGEADRAAGFGPVLAQFWLTLAQASAAWARTSPSDCEGSRASLDQTHYWLANAVRQAPVDAHVFHTAGTILNKLFDLEFVEEAERAELLERSCMSLREADRLAPGRFDILSDLGMVLSTQADSSEGSERDALLREAVQRFDEAARCFDATHRRFVETGKLHPSYVRAVNCAGLARWWLARESANEEEQGKLLRRCLRQLRLAMESLADQPLQRLILGQAALDLAWLTVDRKARRELFDEACRHLAAAVEMDPNLTREACASWGQAVVGCAALSTSLDRKQLIRQSDQLFARAARAAEGSSAPHESAARSWLRVAAEASAEEEQDAARRAAQAARRANRAEPGSADYDLACALSRLGQATEAAEALLAALAGDPELTSDALRDPDLERLWQARPELREAIAARPGA